MNVLYVHGSHTVRGGDTVYLHQVAQLSSQYGFRCILLSIEREAHGYSVQLLHEGNQIEIKSIAKVRQYISEIVREYRIDIIHIHTIYMPAITAWCLKLRPVFKSAHSTDIICPGSYKFFTKTEEICRIPFGAHCIKHTYTRVCCSRNPLKLAYLYNNVHSEVNVFSKRYKKIIVMSEYVRQECINAGIDGNSIEVNHYFTPQADLCSYSPEGKKRVLFFGRLSVIKGLPYLLEAMKTILLNRNDVELHIAGAGSQLPFVKKLAEELGIGNEVIFHGWQNRYEMRSLLETSYLVVVPSIYPEAFGIVGIEAMMKGKPVVGFDVGGISSWLKNNETGFLVDNKDINALNRSIGELLANETLYKRMSENARRIALEIFVPEVHLQKLLATYKTAMVNDNNYFRAGDLL